MAPTDITALLSGNSARKDPAENERLKLIRPEPNKWTLVGTHLIYKWPKRELSLNAKPIKVAAFDLDGTLVQTKLQNVKFARGPSDWKWLNDFVAPTLERLHQQDYFLVIFTNQGGVSPGPQSKLYANLMERLDQICSELEVPISIFALPKRPARKQGQVPSSESMHAKMRKPQVGMWDALVQILRKDGHLIDKDASYFVGDAAGRKGDFLDSDKQFAVSVGIQFLTPEEIFLEPKQPSISRVELSSFDDGANVVLGKVDLKLEANNE